LSERNVSFSTTNPCTCEVMACRCECKSDGGVDCIENTGKSWVNPELFTVKKSSKGFWGNVGGWFGGAFKSIGGFFAGIGKFFGSLFGLGKYLKYVIPVLVVGFCLCIFFNCGGPMILKQCMKTPAMMRFKDKVIPDKVRDKWRDRKERKRQKKLDELSSDDEDDSDDDDQPPGYDDAMRPKDRKNKSPNNKKDKNKKKTKKDEDSDDDDGDDGGKKKKTLSSKFGKKLKDSTKAAGSKMKDKLKQGLKKNKSPDKNKVSPTTKRQAPGTPSGSPRKSSQMIKRRDDVMKSRIQGRREFER